MNTETIELICSIVTAILVGIALGMVIAIDMIQMLLN